MSSSRNPLRDQVAFVAAATTGFTAENTERSQASYVAEASIAALRSCGLGADDVDGICGSQPAAPVVQSMLGIPEVTWFANPMIPFVNHVAAASSAIHSGLCDVVLLYHAAYRQAWNTGSALKDPFRRGSSFAASDAVPPPESIQGSPGYTAWASRYMQEYGVGKEAFGLVALNDRSNAGANPAASITTPLTMDDYLGARMVRWPLSILDMDMAVDGADAFVLTTAERARDLPHPPVLINALTLGMIDHNEEDQTPSLRHHGQQTVIDSLRKKCDFWIDDIDVYFPYDGFSFIMLNWIENTGWCGPGEAGDFLAEHWVDDGHGSGRIVINGRIPVNPHGGSLSEGGTQGSGHIREAVHQLQGLAGSRQVPDAQRTLVTPGGFFFNAQGLALQRG